MIARSRLPRKISTYKGTTTDAGEYTLLSLPVGLYRVTVENEGFKTYIQGNVRVEVGSTVRLEAKLEVGGVQQSIEVNAQSTALVTENAKVQNTMSSRLIEGLPTVVMGTLRSPFTLAAMTAGVNGGAGSSSDIYGQDLRIGGGQMGDWGLLLDGTSANTNRGGSALWAAVNAPSLEAITEFAIDTNGFKAEYGRAGGGMISFVSKSGTNEYHGNAFDFVRNNDFDARGFFNKTVPIYKQNDFGATVGGPVRIPKLYNGKDKTFFFFSYEGFRNRLGAVTSPIAVPPSEFYKGDLRNAVSLTKDRYIVYDPATTVYDSVGKSYVRQAFPNNTIPLSRFDPLSVKILNIAQNTLTGLRTDVVPGTWQYWQQNYYQSGTSVNPNDKYSVKLDHQLSQANRISAYIGYSKKQTVPGPDGFVGLPGILNSTSTSLDSSKVFRGSLDSTISPQLHNRFYFGIDIFHDANYPLAQGHAQGVCIPNVTDCTETLPQIGTGEFGNWAGVAFNGSDNPTHSFNDDLMWTRGKHIFKGGYMYELSPYKGGGRQYIAGYAGFGAGNTALPNTNFTGLGFASFLLGQASGGSAMTNRWVDMRWRYHAMYFQDDWRVTPRLTLNLGVRYEFNLPPLIGGDKCSNFSATTPNPGADGRLGALVFCGFGPGRVGSHTLAPGWYKGVGPRLGFSWNPQSKTVVRGSAGASYGPIKTANGTGHYAGFAQSVSWSDQTAGITPVFLLNEGMPSWPRPPFIDPSFSNNNGVDWYNGTDADRLPQIWSWNLNIQREVIAGTLLEVGYSAVVGTHLVSSELNYNQANINTLPPGVTIFTQEGRNLLNTAFNNPNQVLQQAGFTKPYANFPGTSSLAQALKPFPQYTNISTGSIGGDHSGHSSYHSLVVKATRRYASDLVVDASYVLSKMFTDAETAWGNGPNAMDQYNRRLDKALSVADRTHQIKLNYVYELPVGPGKHWMKRGFLSRVIGGWRLGAVQQYSSGAPIALTGAYGFPIIGNRPTITTYDGWLARAYRREQVRSQCGPLCSVQHARELADHWGLHRQYTGDHAAGLFPRAAAGPSGQHDQDKPEAARQ